MSYAWWTNTASQQSINEIISDCLEVEITDRDNSAIHLEYAYPITDEEAVSLIPYRFVVKNKCNVIVNYDMQLEMMESKDTLGNDNRLKSEYVAVEFNGEEKKLLNAYQEVEARYKNTDYTSVEARYLTSGVLAPKESKSYSIKLWMDEHVTVEDDSMNKRFISKIVVNSSQDHDSKILTDAVKLGDYVEMEPTISFYTIPSNYTGYSSEQTIDPSELKLWRVITKNEDGTIEMVSEYTSSTLVYLTGQTGYNNLVLTLQSIAEQYANDKYTIGTRHVGYTNQTYSVSTPTIAVCGKNIVANTNKNLESKGCGDYFESPDYFFANIDISLIRDSLNTIHTKAVGTDTDADYWVATRRFVSGDTTISQFPGCVHANFGYSPGFTPTADNGYLYYDYLSTTYSAYTHGYHIRPIVTLKAGLVATGTGSSEDPYQLIE